MDGTGVVVEAYETFAADLRRFVASRTRGGDVVEDVVQEAFARLQSEARAGRTPTNPRGWLYRVSLNLVITGSRRAATARSKAHVMTADAVALSPEALFLLHERSLTLRARSWSWDRWAHGVWSSRPRGSPFARSPRRSGEAREPHGR